MLLAAKTYFSGTDFLPSYIWDKVRAAEAELERTLRVYFEPVVMMPEGYTADEITALGSARWAEEPAYDFSPDMFRGESWGYIVTKHRPIISVSSIKFSYPTPTTLVFDVPAPWIRIDKKYGHIRLVPTGTPFYAPLNAYIMSAVGGGRTIPHMIRISYTAGLSNALTDYPDLADVIKRFAVLKIIEDTFPAQSGSISADGLSQSMSVDMDKYQTSIDRTIDRLRSSIHGIQMVTL